MGDLLALADRVEKEAAGSRELDGLIFKAVYEQPGDYWSNEIFEGVWMRRDKDDRVAYDPPDQYTSSLDAAMTLVPENVYWLLGKGKTRPDEPLFAFQILDHGGTVLAESESDIRECCVVAAALRAVANGSAT